MASRNRVKRSDALSSGSLVLTGFPLSWERRKLSQASSALSQERQLDQRLPVRVPALRYTRLLSRRPKAMTVKVML